MLGPVILIHLFSPFAPNLLWSHLLMSPRPWRRVAQDHHPCSPPALTPCELLGTQRYLVLLSGGGEIRFMTLDGPILCEAVCCIDIYLQLHSSGGLTLPCLTQSVLGIADDPRVPLSEPARPPSLRSSPHCPGPAVFLRPGGLPPLLSIPRLRGRPDPI